MVPPPGVAVRDDDPGPAATGGVAARTELHLRAAKKSLELHPPVSVDKGTIVEERSEGLGAVTYIGDDVGDLPAFEALDRLAEQGLAAVKVAVRTPDVSAALTQQAHVLVDGPQGALELLRSLEPDG